ncbi:MAG: type III pantothenate kinase [Candidatus Omnitrophica bacterium]|nr:type III pantothenate kinase [Candidatus Omnitrophota bacterium]MCF7894930.1 type III pantothenate kinase [Candidatus Omnitrophota bacterium]
MIAIDAGNTSIKFGTFYKNKLKKVFSLKREKANKKNVKKVLSNFDKNSLIFLCSVVPEINNLFINLKRTVYLVGDDLKIPIKSLYDKDKVGSDRLLAAYAAKKIEGSLRLIVDFGTAITLDFISKKGDYQGGIILPGINSTLKTFKNCALLPNNITIKKTKRVIPKNTSESINKGLQDGFSLMINGLVDKYKKKLRLSKKDKVIVTGGDFLRVKPYLNFNFQYEKHLVLQGLFCLYQDFLSKNS